ncbi:MAG: bifunctional phosphoglucose/phosphomannose isomerase, partial [Nanoarchaeota archaeon]|nr:bifunctional phosphoglucose/phosphomannose isomerase [Nanoarchaeota archaeon]
PEDYHKFDPQDMRRAILETPLLAEKGYKIAEPVDISKLNGKYTSVIIAGMGGSSIAGLLLQSYLADDKIHIHVVQDYYMPAWADEKTLVFACSYSGNTEETLSTYKDARRKGCAVLAVATGGKLAEMTKMVRVPTVIIPTGYQPRVAMAMQFFAMLRLLERLRLVESKATDVLKLKDDLKPLIPSLEKNAVVLSEKLIHKTPIIYTSTRFGPVGYRWKCQFNENSKVFAFNNVFSEMNHNETEGFEHPRGHYHAILLKFTEDHRRVQRRMSLTKEIIIRKGISDTEIGIRGPSLLSKLFSAVLLGDLTSYYLALRLRVNPSEVHIIENFKKDLGPFVA